MLAELNEALDQLDRDPPRGLVIASGKANGFIAGADVDEFKAIDDEAAALAHRASAAGTRSSASPRCKYPTVALVRGFCLGGGLELALACRYRVVVDEPGTRLGLPEVMLGHRARLGRDEAPAAARRRAGGARPHADRPHDRRAPREAARHRRRMRAARGSWRTRRAAS